MSSSVCSALFKVNMKKLKCEHHCAVSRLVFENLAGLPNIKVTIHILRCFTSVAIKEHHQEHKDLVKDMSVNDM